MFVKVLNNNRGFLPDKTQKEHYCIGFSNTIAYGPSSTNNMGTVNESLGKTLSSVVSMIVLCVMGGGRIIKRYSTQYKACSTVRERGQGRVNKTVVILFF